MTGAVLGISDALLEKYPGFSSLCARISLMFDDRLVPKQLSEELQRAKTSLAEARSQYLANNLVYSELKNILASRQYGLKAEEEDGEEGDPVVALLSEALSREEAKEYINLSMNPKAQNAENLFGLSKDDFEVEHRQKKNVHQIMQQNFTPLLEAKLRERSLELFRFWNPSSTDSDGLAIAKANQLPGVLSTHCARLASRKKELKDLSRKNDDLQHTYCRHLTNLLQQIEKIVEKYHVSSESEIAQSTARWLDAKCDFMLLKVRVMTEHLLAQTYSVDTVKALKKVRNHLEQEGQKTRLELSRAKEALRIYESVGITFKQLAEEYARLISDIDNKKWVLAELKKNLNDS